MPSSAHKRILTLRDLLERANRAYFVEAESIMTDSEYDGLLEELIELEEAHPQYLDPNSPSRRVGGEPIDAFRTVAHALPMQSIDNTYSVEDLRAWHDRVVKGLGPDAGAAYVCDPKIDGVAISLRYERGALVRAVTRGDGERGDDVTAQVRTIRAVPLRLRSTGASPPEVLEVRGEIFMPNAEFDRINQRREAAGEPPFANARNATAGTLKQLDPKVAAGRRLSLVAHGRGEVVGLDDVGTFWGFLERLEGFGIPVSPHTKHCATIDEAIAAVESFRDTRSDLGYGIDGMVVRVDRFDHQERLGSTSKAPRWCIAFKYPPEQGTTVLQRVDWQVGKGGTLTPRATMEPIFLAGTTVRHATLHNLEEIKRKDIRLGDTVVIEKAGEIIPQVVRAVVERRTGREKPIVGPKRCPECSGVVEPEGPKLYCVNPECPAQFRERVKWFVGRGQMDLDGMGEKLVDQLVDTGLVRHFADLYTLQRDDLLDLERMGEKSVDNLLAAIDASRGRGLARVLAGLGIRHIGSAAAKTLAGHFADVDALRAASRDDLEAIPDFGAVTAATLHAYLHSGPGRDTLERLAAVGIDLTSPAPATLGAEASVLSGKRVVLTGGLDRFTRSQLTEKLESLGARVTTSLSGKTDLLIAGSDPGSKVEKARVLGVEIWDEPKLLATLDRESPAAGASDAEH